jgi:hypothetical protein
MLRRMSVPRKKPTSERLMPPLTSEERRKAIEEAIESVAKEGVIPAEEVEAWLDSLGTDHELPKPKPRRL